MLLAGSGMLLISLDSLGIRLAEADRWDVTFWLGVFTVLAMLVVVPIRSGRSLPAVARAQGLPMLASGLLQAASTTFFVLAITLTTVANTVVIVAAAPVVAALIAHVVIGERSGLRTWIAIFTAIGGILIVVSGSLGSGRLEGDLMAVAAILAFSINLILWRRLPDLHRSAAVGLGGLFMAMIALWPADPAAVGARALVILALLGGLFGPAGRVAVASSTRYLAAAQVSLFAPVETVAATGWAWLFLGEAPPSRTIVGGIVVVAAVVYGTALRPSAAAAHRTP